MKISKVACIKSGYYLIIADGKQGVICFQTVNKKINIAISKGDFSEYIPEKSLLRTKDGSNFSISIIIPVKYDDIKPDKKDLIVRKGFYSALFSFSQDRFLCNFEYERINKIESVPPVYVGIKNNKVCLLLVIGDKLSIQEYDSILPITQVFLWLKREKKSFLFYVPQQSFSELPENITNVKCINREYLLCLINNKWGLYSFSGKELIPPLYDQIVKDGTLFRVTHDKQIGIYNSKFILVVPPDFTLVKPYKNGLFYVETSNMSGLYFPSGEIIPAKSYKIQTTGKKGDWILINGKYGLISSKGELLIKPRFDSFREIGSAEFVVVLENYKYGLLSFSYGLLVEPRYDEIRRVQPEELLFVKENGKWGIIYFNGKELLPPCYNLQGFPSIKYLFSNKNSGKIYLNVDKDKIFSERLEVGRKLDYSWYILKRNGKWILLDEKGSEHGTFPYRKISALSEEFFSFQQGSKWGLASKDGQIICKPLYDEIKYYRAQFFKAKIRNKWGVISTNGSSIIPCLYDEISYQENGLFLIQQQNRWGIISQDGEMVIKPAYDSIDFHDKNTFVVRSKEKVGLIHRNGAVMLEPLFDEIIKFPKNTYKFRLENRWGLIRIDGTVVTEPFYDQISECNDKAFLICLNSKWGLISTDDWTSFVPCFNSIKPIPGYMYAFLKNEKWGAIDIKGNVILPPEYDDIALYSGEKFTVIYNGQRGSININEKKFIRNAVDNQRFITGDTARRSTKDPLPKNIRGGYTTYDFSEN